MPVFTADAAGNAFPVSVANIPTVTVGNALSTVTANQGAAAAAASAWPIQISDTSNAAGVFPAGFLRVTDEPTQIFYDPFDSILDTVNRWNTPLSSGTGAATVAVVLGNITVSAGTVANGYADLQSQPSFGPTIPGWLGNSWALKVEAGAAITNAERFWGIGTTATAPTASAPVFNGYGWEIFTDGKMYAVTYSAGTRTVIQDLSSATGNGKQPTDGNFHRYIIYYRTDRIFWYIDSLAPSGLVASASFAIGPLVQTLPLAILAVNSATPPSAVPQLISAGLAVWDTGKNNHKLSDGTYGWRQATIKPGTTAAVSADTALVVALSPASGLPAGTNAIGTVTAVQGGVWTTSVGNVVSVVGSVAATQTGVWTTSIGNQPTVTIANTVTVTGAVSQLGTWTTSIGNIPTVSVGNTITAVGSVAATQTGVWTTSLGNIPTVVVSGFITVTQSNVPTVGVVLYDGAKATYSAALFAGYVGTIPIVPGPVFALGGSGTKTIRITRIGLSAFTAAGATAGPFVNSVQVQKFTGVTGTTGFTSTNFTAVALDSNDGAATALLGYRATQTTGAVLTAGATLVVRNETLTFPSTPTFATAGQEGFSPNVEWLFGNRPGERALVLRGTSQYAAIGVGFTIPAGVVGTSTMGFEIQWTEE